MHFLNRSLLKSKIFLGSLCILIILASIVYVLYFTDLFILRDIKVLNTKRVNKSEIIKLTGLKGGERLFRIPLNTIRERIIKSNPYIKDVTLIRCLPGTLEIRIKERKPLAIIVKNNKGYLIDKYGVVLGEISPEDYFSYPIIEIKNKSFKKKLLKFLAWLKNHKNYLPIYENLEKVIVTDDKLILVTKKNKIHIYLPLFSQKNWIYYYKNLDRIMTYLYEKKLDKKVKLIRLDYPLGEALIKFRS